MSGRRRTTLEAQRELESALHDLGVLVLAIVSTPRALISIAILGFGLAAFAWFVAEVVVVLFG